MKAGAYSALGANLPFVEARVRCGTQIGNDRENL